MIPYSLHVAILLAVSLLFYKLLLQKETYYRLNRLLLLACLALAFLLPLVRVPQQFSVRNTPLPVSVDQPKAILPELPPASLPPVQVKSLQTPVAPSVSPAITASVIANLIRYSLWAYWCGVCIFGANLALQVIVVLFQLYRRPVIRDGIFRIAEMEENKSPYSFGNTIFINPAKYDWDTYSQILIHEKAHIRQGHSFDLVLAELVLVFQWFNPFAWWYRRELESNLEFLADESVLQHPSIELGGYQLSLLKVSVPNLPINITTNYNQSLLKKRIVMMNAKKSNIHILWKYFALPPLMIVLLCSLNDPAVQEDSKLALADRTIQATNDLNLSKGDWYGNLKPGLLYVEFAASKGNRKWSDHASFAATELPQVPREKKADFIVTREAGTVKFNGKFDGGQGYGRYTFTVNKDYKAFIARQNRKDLENDDYFSFFLADVRKSYVEALVEKGFRNLGKNELISMAAANIDTGYIDFWKSAGLKNLTAGSLVSLKSHQIDSAFFNDMQRNGFTNLSVQQLLRLKAQGVTGNYISDMRKAAAKQPLNARVRQTIAPAGTLTVAIPEPSSGSTADVSANLPDPVLTAENLGSMKSMGISPQVVGDYREAGIRDLSANNLSGLLSRNISPQMVGDYRKAGIKDLSVNNLYGFSSRSISPQMVSDYHDAGVDPLSVNNLYGFSTRDISPEVIKNYRQAGIKDLSVNNLYNLKTRDISPETIKNYRDAGVEDLSVNNLYNLKTREISPEYVSSFRQKGLKQVTPAAMLEIRDQGITPDFIKAMQDLGYPKLSSSQLQQLKFQQITPGYVAAFQKLGFSGIAVSQLVTLKQNGITPEYVAQMKKNGFDSPDLSKYIQLKSFNNGTPKKGGQ